MSEQPRRERGKPATASIVGLIVSGLLLALLTPIAVLFMGLAAMTTDSCGPGDQRARCIDADIWGVIPLGVTVLAFLLILILGAVAITKRRPTAMIQTCGWVLVVLGFAIPSWVLS